MAVDYIMSLATANQLIIPLLDEDLAYEVGQTLRESGFRYNKGGLHIKSITNGEIYFDYNAEPPLSIILNRNDKSARDLAGEELSKLIRRIKDI